MWKERTKFVPVVTGALGTIKKGLYQNLQLLPGHPLAIQLRKFAPMNGEHILPKVLG